MKRIPWGKLGGPAHRRTVQKLAELLRKDGFDVETEVPVKTPMGAKGTRYIDVVGVKESTGETKMYQVGDQKADGSPIAGEQSALNDIEQATQQRPDFVSKNLGEQLDNLEMGISPVEPGMVGEGEVPETPELPIELPPL